MMPEDEQTVPKDVDKLHAFVEAEPVSLGR